MDISPYFFTPPPLPKIIIPTGFMVEIENRLKTVFHQGGFLMFYGSAGAGKSTTAEWITERINSAFDSANPLAYKAVLHERGTNKVDNSGKVALRRLYKIVAGYPYDSGTYRNSEIEFIADQVLYAIMRQRIGVIFEDEAGLLSVEQLSALALILDCAKQQNYYLTIVLIGMDDLPQKLDPRQRPQLWRRVSDWCHFKNYDVADTYQLLAGLHPYFAGLDYDNNHHFAQIKLIHELNGGLPGLLVHYLAKFDAYYQKPGVVVNTVFLRVIHERTVLERNNILSEANGHAAAYKKNRSARINGMKTVQTK